MIDYSKWEQLTDPDSEAAEPAAEGQFEAKFAAEEEGKEAVAIGGHRKQASGSRLSSAVDESQLEPPAAGRGPVDGPGEATGGLEMPRPEKTKDYHQRKKVYYQNRMIYSWEQDLEDVHIYIQPPPGTKAADLDIQIQVDRLRVGLKGADRYFLDHELGGLVDVSESLWTLDDGELAIQLQKAEMGTVWPAAFAGHGDLNPEEEERVKKRLLLERFARENPGFDFSNAVISGSAPEAATFMGGLDRNRFKR